MFLTRVTLVEGFGDMAAGRETDAYLADHVVDGAILLPVRTYNSLYLHNMQCTLGEH